MQILAFLIVRKIQNNQAIRVALSLKLKSAKSNENGEVHSAN